MSRQTAQNSICWLALLPDICENIKSPLISTWRLSAQLRAVIIYLQDLTTKEGDFLHVRDCWIIKIDTLNSQDCALWANLFLFTRICDTNS